MIGDVPARDVRRALLDRADALLRARRSAGRVTSNCRNDGDAWTQRCASMTLENRPTTPFEPGGTVAARSSITAYGSTPRRRASSTSARQNPSRNQRIVSPQRNPIPSSIHWSGHGVAQRAEPARPGRSAAGRRATACCQNVPPTTVSRARGDAPEPDERQLGVRAADDDGRARRRGRSAAAAAGVTSPITVPGSTTSGNTARSHAAHGDDLVGPRPAPRSNMPELAPHDGSVAKRPLSRWSTQSLSIVRCAVALDHPGSCAWSHRSRGGDVIDDPVAARSRRCAGRPRWRSAPATRRPLASRRSGTPTARGRRRRTGRCPRACSWRLTAATIAGDPRRAPQRLATCRRR